VHDVATQAGGDVGDDGQVYGEIVVKADDGTRETGV
jgi:hypothetical protein